MSGLLHQLRLFFIALQFFTRLPIPRWVGFEPAWLQQAARYFPWVGAVVGALLVAVFWGAHWLLPVRISVLIAIAAGLLITGAFHEDGLADTADGLGGSAPRAQALTIMKDSRIGTFGAAALIIALLLRWESLSAQPRASATAALLIFGHAASRFCAGLLIRTMDYVRDDDSARAKPVASQLDTHGVLISAVGVLIALAASLAIDSAMLAPFLAGAMLAALITIWFARVLRRRLGGYTGDTLGAAQQLAETAFYIGALAVIPNLPP